MRAEKTKPYTYQNYLNLSSDKNYEIIDGVIYAMTPAPTTKHQRISKKLFSWLDNYFMGGTCEVFYSPFDVLLPNDFESVENSSTVVQPDLLVVCDPSKITEKYCVGSPDFIIEIASPSSLSNDYVKKLALYEKHKVKEYWIVNYVHQEIMVYRLKEDEYGKPEIFKEGRVTVGIFDDLSIDLQKLFNL